MSRQSIIVLRGIPIPVTEVSELSDLWWDYEENIKEVKQQVVDHLIEMVDTASEAVDNIQDVMDTFKDAADEYAKKRRVHFCGCLPGDSKAGSSVYAIPRG